MNAPPSATLAARPARFVHTVLLGLLPVLAVAQDGGERETPPPAESEGAATQNDSEDIAKDLAEGPEDPGDHPAPAAGEEDGLESPDRVLELRIESAVAIALVNDIGLQIESVATDVARFDALGSWGRFDWVFDAEASYLDGEQKGDSDLSGAQVLTFDTRTFGLDLSRPLEWGGDVNLRFDTSTTETNNQFARANPSTTDVLELTYTQPLLRGLGSEHATADQKAADLAFAQQLQNQRAVRQDVERRVRDAYWDLVLTIEELDVANKGLELVTEQLEREERRVEVGVGTEVEVLEAAAQVARREEALLQADVNVRAAEDAMKQMLFPGTDRDVWETRIVPSTRLPERAGADRISDWTDTLAIALGERAELEQQRIAIESAEVMHDFARNDARLGLDLNLSVTGNGFSGSESEALEEALSLEFPTYRAGLLFNAPIRNRTRRNAERAARARLRSERLAFDQLESQVVAEVRDAVRQVRFQAKAVDAAQRSLEASRRQYEAENLRHREGLSTAFRLLEFQNQLEEAALSERAARVAYQKSLVQLRAAQGLLGRGTW